LVVSQKMTNFEASKKIIINKPKNITL